jgi:hypothetical protein
MDESKLIFYTGAPGSKWSATAHLISMNQLYPINTSDYDNSKVYTHSDIGISHLGAYWGPGNGIGEQFHDLQSISKEEIISEIEKPYADKNWDQYRLIKCHHFSNQLDFIKNTFPKSKIIIVLRPDIICFKGWISAGGFEGITYPDYKTFYKDEKTLEKKIDEENHAARDFIHRHDLDIHIIREKYWKQFWKIERTTEEIDRYMRSIEMRQTRGIPRWNYDTVISHYNFKDLS